MSEKTKVENYPIIVTCKVAYDFQSIEFQWTIENEDDKAELLFVSKSFLEGLKAIADEIPNPNNKSVKKAAPKEEGITDGQLNYLVGLGFPKEEAVKLTKKQASIKIKEMS